MTVEFSVVVRVVNPEDTTQRPVDLQGLRAHVCSPRACSSLPRFQTHLERTKTGIVPRPRSPLLSLTANMSNTPTLSDAQKDSFAANGFLILRNILTPQDQEALIAWTEEVKAWPDTPGRYTFVLDLSELTACLAGTWMPYLEIDAMGRKVVSRVENYANYHDGFSRLLREDVVTGILEQLSGEKMWLMKEKINVSDKSEVMVAADRAPFYILAVQAGIRRWIRRPYRCRGVYCCEGKAGARQSLICLPSPQADSRSSSILLS